MEFSLKEEEYPSKSLKLVLLSWSQEAKTPLHFQPWGSDISQAEMHPTRNKQNHLHLIGIKLNTLGTKHSFPVPHSTEAVI